VLEPQRLGRDRRFARLAQPYGPATVYFLDDRSYPEPSGFWVAGRASTELIVDTAGRAPGAPVTLQLRNGAARNVVTIEADGSTRTEAMEPSRTEAVELRSQRPDGAIALTIRSDDGFRPSERGDSRDDRLLGVWIAIQ